MALMDRYERKWRGKNREMREWEDTVAPVAAGAAETMMKEKKQKHSGRCKGSDGLLLLLEDADAKIGKISHCLAPLGSF